ncbi:hypothetical protein [Pyrofollis japonicus]|uniref:hypothetical protein n=1 Tax=Pyrofollis japonicus TaxID=3060460 RepID=UPI00295B7F9F|nr:hypothetical protein [Pyrofollis japonicus]
MAWRWWGRGWGWKGGWWGPWPGKGPFSYLPPWMRPGWVFGGRGACWRLFGLPGWIYWNRYYPWYWLYQHPVPVYNPWYW